MQSEYLPEWLPLVLAIAWVAILFTLPYFVPILFARHIGRVAARMEVAPESLRFIDADTSYWSRCIVIGIIPAWIVLGCLLEFQLVLLIWPTLGLTVLVVILWFGSLRRITGKLLTSTDE